MQTNPCYATTCHNCRFFQPEGHHYGNCDRMHIIVEGEWPACHLALPAFNSLGQQLGTSIEESIQSGSVNQRLKSPLMTQSPPTRTNTGEDPSLTEPDWESIDRQNLRPKDLLDRLLSQLIVEVTD